MIDNPFEQKTDDSVLEQDYVKIPGFENNMHNRDWEMRFKLFDFGQEDDIAELEDIFTRSTKKNSSEGVVIFHQEGSFFQDGSYKMMLRWGLWKSIDKKKKI